MSKYEDLPPESYAKTMDDAQQWVDTNGPLDIDSLSNTCDRLTPDGPCQKAIGHEGKCYPDEVDQSEIPF